MYIKTRFVMWVQAGGESHTACDLFPFYVGKYKVLQCLISLHKTFNSTEPYYFINNFYITDYCIWIQSTKSSVLDSLADEIEQVLITTCYAPPLLN